MINKVSAMIGNGKLYFKWGGDEMKKKGEIFSENGKNINKNSFRLRQCAQARKTHRKIILLIFRFSQFCH